MTIRGGYQFLFNFFFFCIAVCPILCKSEASESDLIEFLQYVNDYNKEYSNQTEFEFRFQRFLENRADIHQHNADIMKKYKRGLNQFSDLSIDEYRSMLNPYLSEIEYTSNTCTLSDDSIASSISSVDWRYSDENPKGIVAVTSIKDQGSCGACWAFATSASIEGRVAIDAGVLNSVSVQQLVDCDTESYGCNGGYISSAFLYAEQNGLDLYSQYPFTGDSDESCKSSQYSPIASISSFCSVLPCDETLMVGYVAESPVTIAIDASCTEFQSYTSGIITDSCGNTLDHAVLLIGYGSDDGTDYWTIKNSWGTSWGEEGFARIARGVSGHPCGISGILYTGTFPKGGVSYVNVSFSDDNNLDDDKNIWSIIFHQSATIYISFGVIFIITCFSLIRLCLCICYRKQTMVSNYRTYSGLLPQAEVTNRRYTGSPSPQSEMFSPLIQPPLYYNVH